VSRTTGGVDAGRYDAFLPPRRVGPAVQRHLDASLHVLDGSSLPEVYLGPGQDSKHQGERADQRGRQGHVSKNRARARNLFRKIKARTGRPGGATAATRPTT
jgi:hypothetical protein